MIKGHVDDNLQASVPVALLDRAERRSVLSMIVDTGFNGDLCVSIAEIEKLDLTFSHSQKFELGDGSIVAKDVFWGQVIFDNKKLLVKVLVSDSSDTLIGAALLANKKLEVDYPNKAVRIKNSRKKK